MVKYKGQGRPKKKSRGRHGGANKILNTKKASRSTKYRRSVEFVNEDPDVLAMALKKLGGKNGSKRKEKKQKVTFLHRHTPETALAYMLEQNFTKEGYTLNDSDARDKGARIYPCYKKLDAPKAECRPKNTTQLSENEVFVPLQNVLDKTSERLVEALQWPADHYELHVSLGFDSSASHLSPNQSFEKKEKKKIDSSVSLFVSCFTILAILSTTGKKMWINPTPQSVRFCRPLRVCYEKETEESSLREFERLEREALWIHNHKFKNASGEISKVKYKISKTLFDGKCVNCILGNKATTRCPICGKTSSEFKDTSKDFSPISEDHLKLGLGLLHVEIKCFEHCLHLAYKKKFQCWEIGERSPFYGKPT